VAVAVDLLGPAEIRALSGQLGVRPSKRLGQNFVIDPGTIRRIVQLAGLDPGEVVLEVGPGLGSLTLGLLGAAGSVIAVEVDPVLAAQLPQTAAERAGPAARKLRVVNADALRVGPAEVGAPTALVANLPYNIAVPVLLHLLEALPTLRHGLVMVQSEVADRICAPPGSRIYGAPSVKLAWYADVRRAGSVSRSVFWPAPNVDSALVALARRTAPAASREAVFVVVNAAFAQRRKTLRAALAGWAGTADAAAALLRAAGVDPALRGEAIGLDDYIRIAEAAGPAREIIGT
jgi:16S rRNA (adenine1518-N6/adenine1519-N6)-dimethyltransferase